jgi:hypothetical protein
MGVESEPLLAVGQSRNWWNPGGALGRWGWSWRRRDWSGGAASSFGRWGWSELGEAGGVIGVVVLWRRAAPKGHDWSGQIGAEGGAIAWSSRRWCGGSLRWRCGCSLSGHAGSVVGA